ncbi:hypothetical protein LAJ57_12990, partial [Streptococcus pneumoniae]|uniref:hypothetical protein n=1 Tax=Streptococcus pneumoniae TaxID=1313 RepID=UPI001CBBAB94
FIEVRMRYAASRDCAIASRVEVLLLSFHAHEAPKLFWTNRFVRAVRASGGGSASSCIAGLSPELAKLFQHIVRKLQLPRERLACSLAI